MKTKTVKVLFSIAAWLAMLAVSSIPVSAQSITPPLPVYQYNLLLIHGRTDSSTEQFGVFTYDQLGAWNGTGSLVTLANVYYVQWDAWNRHFDDTTCPGGYCIIDNAVNTLCDWMNNKMCWIICHSAGCAALENMFAKDPYGGTLGVGHVIAADSAAGGSELADNGVLRFIGGLMGASAAIDDSLKTSYARGAYDHNSVGNIIRGIAGTNNDSSLTSCHFFPMQHVANGSDGNTDCTACISRTQGLFRQCDDGAVALHSTCGHNQVASFQDCNSTIRPHSDTAGTYAYHGWWISDSWCNFEPNGATGNGEYCGPWSGPYSSQGLALGSSYNTYRVNHSGGKQLAIAEYSSSPATLCP